MMEVAMRGSDAVPGALFSYVDLEARVPQDHPLRVIRRVVNDALGNLDAEFGRLYSAIGRPSIAPEKLIRGSLLQGFYTIRSERQLMEQLDYNLMFRWFVGLGVDDPIWDHSVYSKNRDRLLEADIARKLLAAILAHPEVAPLLSDEHFSVDGTMINAWASMKSFVPKEEVTKANTASPEAGNTPAVGEPPVEPEGPSTNASGESKESDEEKQPAAQVADTQTPSTQTAPISAETSDMKSRNAEVDFHGAKRSNATHVSSTDPQARLFRKGRGKEARLCYMGHTLMENRHGLIVETALTQATGTAEREAAIAMIEVHSPGSQRLTLGADKGYDTSDFVADLRQMSVTPHVAQNTSGRASAIDTRTTRHEGYGESQRKRKQIEEAFGWGKTIGGLARPMRHGVRRMAYVFTTAMSAYNLIRLPKLLAAAAV
jgi:transposase